MNRGTRHRRLLLAFAVVTIVAGCARTAEAGSTSLDASASPSASSSVSVSQPVASTESSTPVSQTPKITKPDPTDTDVQTVRESVSCPAPGSLPFGEVAREADTAGLSLVIGTVAMGHDVRQDKRGMLYTEATITVTRRLAGAKLPHVVTAYVPGGEVEGLAAIPGDGLATGPDGQFLGLVGPPVDGLDVARVTGVPVVGDQVYFTPTTCLQPDGLPGTTASSKTVKYVAIEKGKPTQVTTTAPVASVSAVIQAIGG